jgi:hypothetical protein
MLATLLQQSARRYVRVTQRRYSAHKRARIRAFFAHGLDDLLARVVVDALPALLHLSLFLFFAGLLIYLYNISHATFSAVAWWVGLSATLYTVITIMPIFRQDSPYYAPLSSTAWYLYSTISYAIFSAICFVTSLNYFSDDIWERFADLKDRYQGFLRGVETAAEEKAWKRSSKIDARVLEWTVDTLGEDDSLERFFEAIPGFYNSKEVKDLQRSVPSSVQAKFSQSLDGFLDRTLSSNTVSDSVKTGRLIICLDAVHAAQSSSVSGILHDILSGRWLEVPQSVELGHSLTRWSNSGDGHSALFAKSIIAGIVAGVQERDERWSALARDHLGVPEDVFEKYATNDENVLLASLMHVTRQTLPSFFVNQYRLQLSISGFDIQKTLPDLQHEFCDFWNEIVLEAQKTVPYSSPVYVLANIRHLYVALHQDTPVAPTAFSLSTDTLDGILYRGSSYPICNIPDHHPPSITAPHIHDMTEEDAALAASSHTATRSTTFGVPPITVLKADQTIPPPVYEPSLDGVPDTRQCLTPATSSSHTTIEMVDRGHFFAASSDTTTAGVAQVFALPADRHSPPDSATIVSSHILHELAPRSSDPKTSLIPAPLKVPSVPDLTVVASTAISDTHDQPQDENLSAHTESPHHPL